MAGSGEAPEGKYVYCVIRCDEPPQFSTLGIGERGDEVHTVEYKDLAAVVSDSPVIRYVSSRRNMMAHTVVLEEAMQNHTILPVRFGIVAPSAEAIATKVLQRRYDELSALLSEMDGRIEVGLKAFWYENVIFPEVVSENPAIRQLRDSLMNKSAEETYYERIRLGEMIESAMGQRRDEDADRILGALRPLAYETRLNEVITDRMIVNAAFLVDVSRQSDFDEALEGLDTAMGERILFKYVGPVPPYNFVNLTVQWND
jgi:hypothetical protein